MTVSQGMNEAPKFIIELNRDEIEFIAAAAHLLKFHYPDHPTPKSLIQALVEQTEFVSSNPDNHGLNFQLRQPLTSQQKWGHLTGTMELSNLQQLIAAQEI